MANRIQKYVPWWRGILSIAAGIIIVVYFYGINCRRSDDYYTYVAGRGALQISGIALVVMRDRFDVTTYKLGMAALAEGDCEMVRTHLKPLLKKYPKISELHLNVGRCEEQAYWIVAHMLNPKDLQAHVLGVETATYLQHVEEGYRLATCTCYETYLHFDGKRLPFQEDHFYQTRCKK